MYEIDIYLAKVFPWKACDFTRRQKRVRSLCRQCIFLVMPRYTPGFVGELGAVQCNTAMSSDMRSISQRAKNGGVFRKAKSYLTSGSAGLRPGCLC